MDGKEKKKTKLLVIISIERCHVIRLEIYGRIHLLSSHSDNFYECSTSGIIFVREKLTSLPCFRVEAEESAPKDRGE